MFCLVVVLTALTFQTGGAITCYQCSSKTNNACKDPVMTNGNTTLKPVECFPQMAFSSKSFSDILPGSVLKTLDTIGSSIGKVASQTTEMVCLKLNIRSGEEMYTMRSCAVAIKSSDGTRSSNACDLAKRASENKTDFCEFCLTDLCNSAPSFIPINIFSWLFITTFFIFYI